jgi:outer membrane protein OmpA-like peptidoglycan-associated protein
MLIVKSRIPLLFKFAFLISLFISLSSYSIRAQDIFTDEKTNTTFLYDEIPVTLIIEGFGNYNLDVIYTNDEVLYVNVEVLFKVLNIPCAVGQKGDSLGGFLENESRTYFINYKTGQIKLPEKTINAQEGMIQEMGAIYLESSIFPQAFGISLTFNFRALTIILKSEFELPIIKQQRLEKVRKNLLKVRGEIIADTILKRYYHAFKFGTIDWSVVATQSWNKTNENRFRLGVGTELLYGEADLFIDYNDKYRLNNRQIKYIWRWVDNDKRLIKQAEVGKISNQTISFINSPIIGAVIRNSPTTIRKASGYYTINEYTEPNWTVELYINNVMVDYTKADASGLFIFKVPNVYGFTTLKLKFYGPMGEERTDERTINLPYNFMPVNEFEYGISAGIVQDSSLNRFGRSEINYGVSRTFTAGGGMEYLSSIPNGPFIPFVKGSFQALSNLTLNAEYAYGVKISSLINYYFFKRALLTIDFTKFKEGQLATQFKYLEARKAAVSLPYRLNKISGFGKVDFTQYVYNKFNFNQANTTISFYYKRFNTNVAIQSNWTDLRKSYLISFLSMTYRFKNGVTITPSAQYNIRLDNFLSYKVMVEKIIPKGYLSLSYEKNILYNTHFVNLTFRYDLSFARTSLSAQRRGKEFSTIESAQGSFAFGSGNKYIHVSNNISVGRGGISLYPFLDVNNNGKYDQGEKMVKITSVKIYGGKVIFSDKDSIIRMPDLIPFTNYNVEFDDNELENISWRFKHRIWSVIIDPNQFKRIDIPVSTVGEAVGTTYMNNNNSLKGLGRILVKYYKKGSDQVIAESLSESDGYINFLGFEPGEYIARVDSVQMSRLDYTVAPTEIPFTVIGIEEGDVADGIDFVLSRRLPPVIPDTSFYIMGRVFDKKTHKPLDAKLNIIDISLSKVIAKGVTQDSGFYKIKLDGAKKYGVEVIAKDYLFFLELADMSNEKPGVPFERDYYLEKIEVGTRVVLENIYFEINKAILTDASNIQLNQVVELLKTNESLKIEISGHTDNVASAEHNTQLSKNRAKAVVDYLVAQGIDSNRLRSKGYGFRQPIESNNTPEGRAKNRRVEFKVISK